MAFSIPGGCYAQPIQLDFPWDESRRSEEMVTPVGPLSTVPMGWGALQAGQDTGKAFQS